MKLRAYLDLHKINNAEFGRKIGVEGISVGRYADSGRVPEPKIMRAITAATSGAVTANDFFDEAPATATDRPKRKRAA